MQRPSGLDRGGPVPVENIIRNDPGRRTYAIAAVLLSDIQYAIIRKDDSGQQHQHDQAGKKNRQGMSRRQGRPRDRPGSGDGPHAQTQEALPGLQRTQWLLHRPPGQVLPGAPLVGPETVLPGIPATLVIRERLTLRCGHESEQYMENRSCLWLE